MKKVFEPIGSYEDIESLIELRENLNEGLVKEVAQCLEDIDIKIYEKLKRYNSRKKEIMDEVSKYFGKYIRATFLYNANYNMATREKEPLWKPANTYNMIPYRFVETNGCLFSVYTKLNDEYSGGVVDGSINITSFIEKYRIEIEEINEETFVEDAQNSVTNCIKRRVEKFDSDGYKKTENGFVPNVRYKATWVDKMNKRCTQSSTKKVDLEKYEEDYCQKCSHFDGYDMCCYVGNWESVTDETIEKCIKEKLFNEKLPI